MVITRKVIDCHIHLKEWFDAEGNDYFQLLDKLQEKTGLEAMNIAVLGYRHNGGPDINMMAGIYKLHNPTAYAYGSLVYPEYPAKPDFPAGMDPLTQYKELMEMGMDGIKFLYAAGIQKQLVLPICDDAFEPMFAQAEKDGTQILWHVADPKFFWEPNEDGYVRFDETHPTHEDLFLQTFEVLQKHPKLHVTFAHFLFLEEQPEILERLFEKYENLRVDLAPGTLFWAFAKRPDYFRHFLEKYADRILFGSDAAIPSNPHSDELIENIYRWITTRERASVWGFEMEGLGLCDEACEKILRGSFLDGNPAPRKMDVQALKAYCSKYSHLIGNKTNKEQIAAFWEK